MCTDVRKGTSWWVKIVRWVNRRSNQGWAEVFQGLESCVAPFSAENYKEDSNWPTKTAENYISSLHFLGFRLICCGQLSYMLRWWKRKEGKDCWTLRCHLLWIYAPMKPKPQSVIRPLLCNMLPRICLPAIFHFLVGILLLVRSRRSPLRLRTHNQPSAQQSNEISSGSNDRFGLKTRDCTVKKCCDVSVCWFFCTMSRHCGVSFGAMLVEWCERKCNT